MTGETDKAYDAAVNRLRAGRVVLQIERDLELGKPVRLNNADAKLLLAGWTACIETLGATVD